MIDREKVIKGLECCNAYDYKCNDCPYQDDGGAADGCYSDELKADALALLKEQEPRTETQGRWECVGSDGIVCCSVCGMPMNKTRVCFPDGESGYYYIATKYCPRCGAKNEKGDCDG